MTSWEGVRGRVMERRKSRGSEECEARNEQGLPPSDSELSSSQQVNKICASYFPQ